MSSWLLFSALGFYPLAGSDLFMVGSPRVAQASIRMSRLFAEGEGFVVGEGYLNVTAHDNRLELLQNMM